MTKDQTEKALAHLAAIEDAVVLWVANALLEGDVSLDEAERDRLAKEAQTRFARIFGA